MQGGRTTPVLPYVAAAIVVGFTPVFFLFGILVYRIVRPQERLGEAYERGLAEEALIAEIEQIEHCATCGRKVDEEWIICPTCRTRLKRVCPHCSKLVGLDWSMCAWCGRDFERREAITAVGAVPRPVREAPSTRPAQRPLPGAESAPPAARRPAAAPARRARRPAVEPAPPLPWRRPGLRCQPSTGRPPRPRPRAQG